MSSAIKCMNPNKWYDTIYTSEGPVYDRKVCQRGEQIIVPSPESPGMSSKQLVARPQRSPKQDNNLITFTQQELFMAAILSALAVLMICLIPIIILLILRTSKRLHRERIYRAMEIGSHSRTISEC